MNVRPVVLYARISVTTEESVSVARQLAAGRKYAAARGWRVMGEFIDDGVSATHNKPERRPGWRSLLAFQVPFEAVVVWKVDRLARRVIDFLHADETLQARGAALVCVDQSIDMTTGEGRAFAQMLAVFGEMEAAAISSRIIAARAHLIAEGRIPGGRQPFGWRSVPNPDGPGFVRDQDPEQIGWVRGMVKRVMRGDTVYSVTTWLNESGAPGPRTRREGRPWGYSSVNVLMRNPVLCGMFPVNARKGLDPDGFPYVRRDEIGDPIVAPDGLITVEQFDTLLHAITHKPHPSARHRHGSSSPLLSLLITCRACNVPLYRHHSGKLTYWCPPCGQFIGGIPLGDLVVRRLLAERGSLRMYRRVLDVPDNPAAARRLAAIDYDLRLAALGLTEDRAEADTRLLTEEVARLKRARQTARSRVAGMAVERLTYVGTVKQVWDQCADDGQRHDVLATQIDTLAVSKATHRQRRFNPDRVNLTWNSDRKPIAPPSIAVGPIQRRMRQPSPWVSYRDASRLVGSTEGLIRRGIKGGQITRRKAEPGHPSLDRASVIAFLRHEGSVD